MLRIRHSQGNKDPIDVMGFHIHNLYTLVKCIRLNESTKMSISCSLDTCEGIANYP